jgi:hypothetical protein
MLASDPIGSLVLVEHFLPHQAVVLQGVKEAEATEQVRRLR